MDNLLDAPVKTSTNGMDGCQIIQYYVQNNYEKEIDGILAIQDETPILLTPGKPLSRLEGDDNDQVFHNYFEEIKTWDKEFFAKVAAHLIAEGIDIADVAFICFNSIAIPCASASKMHLTES